MHGSLPTSTTARRPARRRRRLTRWIVILTLLALVGAAVFLVWSRPIPGIADTDLDSTTGSQEPLTVTRGDITPIVTLEATVTPQPRYAVLLPVQGRVVRGDPEPGDVVLAGAPLFEVNDEQVMAEADCLINDWLISSANAPAGLPVVDSMPLSLS